MQLSSASGPAARPCWCRPSPRRARIARHAAPMRSSTEPAAAPPQAPKQPPSPRGPLGLGAFPQVLVHLLRGRWLDQLFMRWTAELGSFVRWEIPGLLPVVLISDHDAIKQVLEVYNWPKTPLYKDLVPVLGARSMVLTEGEAWREQRDIFNPGFSSPFLRASLPGFVACTRRLLDRLDRAADAGEVVRMHDLAVSLTVEVICKVAFAEDVDLLSQQAGDRQLLSSFIDLLDHVSFYLDKFVLNGLKATPWAQARLSRLEREFDAALRPILRRRVAAVQQREQAASGATTTTSSSSSEGGGASSGGGSAGTCPLHAAAGAGAAAANAETAGSCPVAANPTAEGLGDILGLAMQISLQQTGSVDEDTLMSQMRTFFVAGSDTTAGLVAWSMWYLSQHPGALARLRAEADAVLGPQGAAGSGPDPTPQQISELRYLTCVLKETLRLRPPTSFARLAPADAQLHGYAVGGCVVLISPAVQGSDPAVWGPDAAEWRPERWEQWGPGGSEERAAAGGPPPQAYLPFSLGARNCIGARFAMLEAKAILALVVQRFNFEWAGDGPEQVIQSITIKPKQGVPLRITRRAPKQEAPAGA